MEDSARNETRQLGPSGTCVSEPIAREVDNGQGMHVTDHPPDCIGPTQLFKLGCVQKMVENVNYLQGIWQALQGDGPDSGE